MHFDYFDLRFRRERQRVEEIRHFRFRFQQIPERCLFNNSVQRVLNRSPQQPYRAVPSVSTVALQTRVARAELFTVETSAQQRQDFRNSNALRRARQRVPAGLPSYARDQAAEPENPHEFGHIWNGKSLCAADLWDAVASSFTVAGHVQEAPKAILFLGAELHNSILRPFLSDE